MQGYYRTIVWIEDQVERKYKSLLPISTFPPAPAGKQQKKRLEKWLILGVLASPHRLIETLRVRHSNRYSSSLISGSLARKIL